MITTTLRRAVDFADGVPRFAHALGVSHQVVYQWLRRGWVPPKRAAQISALYGVPAAELINPALRRVVEMTNVAQAASDLI